MTSQIVFHQNELCLGTNTDKYVMDRVTFPVCHQRVGWAERAENLVECGFSLGFSSSVVLQSLTH